MTLSVLLFTSHRHAALFQNALLHGHPTEAFGCWTSELLLVVGARLGFLSAKPQQGAPGGAGDGLRRGELDGLAPAASAAGPQLAVAVASPRPR